jgi:hypothetical protein
MPKESGWRWIRSTVGMIPRYMVWGTPVNHRNSPSLRRLSIRERRGAPAHSNVSLVIQHQFTPHAIMIFLYGS